MNEFRRFGSPELFEIAARWTADAEPRERLPLDDGWSTGDLQITVGHQVLTSRQFRDSERSYVSWYLSPLFDWLIQRWTGLFHEEAYVWTEKSDAPAAMAVFAALGRGIASSDEAEREEYRAIQSWWMRHALRAADSSALYPDLCFRRVSDEIEVSWGGRQPVHAPEGFAFVHSPGYAILAVSAVVQPLWQFLEWGLSTAPIGAQNDNQTVNDLKRRFQQLKQTPLKDLELKYLRGNLRNLIDAARRAFPLKESSTLVKNVPAIASLDAAVLMFGGLTPSIGEPDAIRLVEFLSKHQSRSESEALLQLVDGRPLNPALAPYQEGYELADDVREDLEIASSETDVNVQGLLHSLGVDVQEVALDTDTVRGIAVAGAGFAPAILVNTTSVFNRSREGRKFTMAHELCHILFDRSRAKKLSHVSGSWTSARVEKRANAFAAMFLASRAAVKLTFAGSSVEAIKAQAQSLQMGSSALIEHLCNLGLIDEADRERLRISSAT